MTDTELAQRLEKLERDNRRLKRYGAAALVLAAALGAIAATRPVPDVIKAHAFDVVDKGGRIRATMDVDFRGATGLYLRGAEGKLRAEISTETQDTSLNLYDAKGRKRETLSVWGNNPSIRLLDSHEMEDVSIRGGPMLQASPLSWGARDLESEIDLYGGGASALTSIALGVSTDGAPNITLDSGSVQGPRMELGSTSLEAQRTGATQQTSATSIVMFGNDKEHHIIWKAP